MALVRTSSFGEDQASPAAAPDTSLYNIAELVSLRDQLNEQIGDVTLTSLNLSSELVIQYQIVKKLLADSASDENIPLNQRAQAANSCTTLLGQLAKIQEATWNADRLKKLEGQVVQVFRDIDAEVGQELRLTLAERFLVGFKKALGEHV
jgi:hypothetical protein